MRTRLIKSYSGLSFVFLISLIAACNSSTTQVQSTAQKGSQANSAPNFLIIIADDLGTADIGAFGGEIETPNLDWLSTKGAALTNFRAGPACSPTRAMLLSGRDAPWAGLGNMKEEMAPNQKGQPGYEGRINTRVELIPEVLNDFGYQTFISGKWHLGDHEESRPSNRGFDRSFVLMPGGASHFADMKPAFSPDPNAKAAYWEGAQHLEKLPEEYEYSTQYFTDRLMDYLNESDSEKPFFAILSYTAPHWPLQAPDDVIDKYKGRYDDGYDVLRAERLEKQKALGIVPADAQLADLPKGALPWDKLPNDKRKTEIRSMEIYAAMVDEIDRHVGRLLNHLRDSGRLDNTVLIFMSDNGAEGHSFEQREHLLPKDIAHALRSSHDFSYENMGRLNSYTFYGEGWAAAGSPSFSGYKGYVQEGGVRVPAIVYYPPSITENPEGKLIDNRPMDVRDLKPTILQLAQAVSQEPSDGIDLSTYIFDPSKEIPENTKVLELFGKQSVLKYPWKLIREPAPWGDNEWRLYNLENDRKESSNVIDDNQDLAAVLLKDWDDYVERNQVILPNRNSGY